jgi:hypothetical protein
VHSLGRSWTLREPLLVVDKDLRVPAARRLLGIEYLTEQRGNAASLVAGYSIASEITRRSDKRTGAGEHSGEAEARLEYFVGNRALRAPLFWIATTIQPTLIADDAHGRARFF